MNKMTQSHNNYRLAVFDLDGTILDTLSDLADSLNYALADGGFPCRTMDEVRAFVGNGMRRLVELGLPANASVSQVDATLECFNKHYALHYADKTRPYEGVRQLLTKLRDRGMLTAVVSNKTDFAVQELCERFFDRLFDAALGVKPEVSRKPSPDMVLAVLSRLNVDRSEAVYIGDTEVDLLTAANSGLNCISVTWGFRSRDFLLAHGAKVLCDTPSLLDDLI